MRVFLSRFGRWAIARASEKSTVAGFVMALTATGQHLSPEITDALTWLVPFIAGGLMAASEGGEK